MNDGVDLDQVKRELREHQNELWKSWETSPPEKLHHYTSATALCNILRTGQFWAFDMKGLNDAEEGKYWIDVVRPIVNRNSVSESLKQSFNRDRNSFGLHQDWFSYVASFSGRNDIANQWNRYARNGTGCAITVDYKCLFSEAGIQYSLARMAYDRHDQSCKVDDTLKKAIDLRRELGIPYKHGKYWFEVFMSLYVCGLRFKEPAFAEEEEWRVQVFEPNSTSVRLLRH